MKKIILIVGLGLTLQACTIDLGGSSSTDTSTSTSTSSYDSGSTWDSGSSWGWW